MRSSTSETTAGYSRSSRSTSDGALASGVWCNKMILHSVFPPVRRSDLLVVQCCRRKEATMMPRTRYTNEEIGRLGNEIYRRSIRDKVMPQHKGKFLILDIESGDYEVDEDDLSAEDRLRARRPDGVFFGLRIGYTSAYTLAGTMEE